MNKSNYEELRDYLGARIVTKQEEIKYYKDNPGYTIEEKKNLIRERQYHIKVLKSEIFYLSFLMN